MGRLLLFAVLALAVWMLWRALTGGRASRSPKQDERFEPMARCVRCGTYLPQRSLTADGRCQRCR